MSSSSLKKNTNYNFRWSSLKTSCQWCNAKMDMSRVYTEGVFCGDKCLDNYLSFVESLKEISPGSREL